MQLDVLYIHCLILNSKSENVALRCGFHYEGLARYGKEEYKRFAKTIEEFEKELIE